MNKPESAAERLSREALDIQRGARQKAYGKPERNFQRIAQLWTAYLQSAGKLPPTDTLTSEMVGHLMTLMKIARLIETPNHEDSLRDILGYTFCNIEMALEKDGWVDWPPAPEIPKEAEFYVYETGHGNRPLESGGAK